MLASSEQRPQRVHFFECALHQEDVLTEILIGLKQTPKSIHPKFFYDQQGSRLFDKITALPEYYLTRTENEILRRYRNVIATYVGHDSIVLEPGSGSSSKIAILLEALQPQLYVPIDIAATQLRTAVYRLAEQFPWLHCHAVAADYAAELQLPMPLPMGKRVAFYPGSTIGNFDPPAAIDFLRRLATLVGPGGGLLIGVDLQKDQAILQQAYNDRQGVTAAFNRNILRNLNRLLGTDFSIEAFDHLAFYNEDSKRIEMHLQCRYTHDVLLGDQPIHFRAGERIHTENSYKYTIPGFTALAAKAGFRRERTWSDEREFFSVHYLVADSAPVFTGYEQYEELWQRDQVAPTAPS